MSYKITPKRMTGYDLTMRGFTELSDNQLDLEISSPTKEYPFCEEVMLR